jgi:hypothetical protein
MVVGLLSVSSNLLALLSGGIYWNCVNMTNRTCTVVSCQIESHASLLGFTSFEQHCSVSIQSCAGYLKNCTAKL